MRLTRKAGVTEEARTEEESIRKTLRTAATIKCNVAHQFTASTAMKSLSTGPMARFCDASALMEPSLDLMARYWYGGLRKECEAGEGQAPEVDLAGEGRPSTASTATRSSSTDPMAKFCAALAQTEQSLALMARFLSMAPKRN